MMGVEELPEKPSEGDPLVQSEYQEIIREELANLSEQWRQIINLVYFKYRSYAEVAEQLGMPIGSVSGVLKKAHKALGQRLRRRGVELSIAALTCALSIPFSTRRLSAQEVNRLAELAVRALTNGLDGCGASARVIALAKAALPSHRVAWFVGIALTLSTTVCWAVVDEVRLPEAPRSEHESQKAEPPLREPPLRGPVIVRVTGVKDNATLTVGKRNEYVRLAGVTRLDPRHPDPTVRRLAAGARRELEKIVLERKIEVLRRPPQSTNTLQPLIVARLADGECLNELVLRRGLAVLDEGPPTVLLFTSEELRSLQGAARAARESGAAPPEVEPDPPD